MLFVLIVPHRATTSPSHSRSSPVDELMFLTPQPTLLFFFNDTATTEIYTLSLHDALPIWPARATRSCPTSLSSPGRGARAARRSEEHTSELQSRQYLVCRLLLEKKKKSTTGVSPRPTCR